MAFEEQLIYLVREREPLWNLKLSLESRSKEIKDKLWDEIHRLIGGEYTIPELRKKWKNLVDTHRRLLYNDKDENGLSSKKKKLWSHYKSMSFMRDDSEEGIEKRQRAMKAKTLDDENCINISNIPLLGEFIAHEEVTSQPTYVFRHKSSENHEVEIDNEELLQLKNNNPTCVFKFPEIPPPPKGPQTANAAFGLFIECSLKEIEDPHDRVHIQCALMNTLTAELSKIAERRRLENLTDNHDRSLDNNLDVK